MLSHYGMSAANGIYTMAYRVIDLATMPISSIQMASEPRLFQLGAISLQGAAAFGRRLLKRGLLTSMVAAVGMFLLAPLIPLLVGPGFTESISALRWLCLIPVFRSIHGITGGVLTGAGLQRYRTLAQITAVTFNFGLNLWLIPTLRLARVRLGKSGHRRRRWESLTGACWNGRSVGRHCVCKQNALRWPRARASVPQASCKEKLPTERPRDAVSVRMDKNPPSRTRRPASVVHLLLGWVLMLPLIFFAVRGTFSFQNSINETSLSNVLGRPRPNPEHGRRRICRNPRHRVLSRHLAAYPQFKARPFPCPEDEDAYPSGTVDHPFSGLVAKPDYGPRTTDCSI